MSGAPTTIRKLADALLVVRDRENRLSRISPAERPAGQEVAERACCAQGVAIIGAIVREPPQDTSDLRSLLMAAADELDAAMDEGDFTDAVIDMLNGVLIALEHVVVHPALGPVLPGDEAWNVPLYRKRAEARLIDPSQVQQPEQAA